MLCVSQQVNCSSPVLQADLTAADIPLPGHSSFRLGTIVDTTGLGCSAWANLHPDTIRAGDVFTIRMADRGYECRVAPAAGVTGALSLDSLSRLNALRLWFDDAAVLDSLRKSLTARYGTPDKDAVALSIWDDGRIGVVLTRLADAPGRRVLLEWIDHTLGEPTAR
ncbi:MAG: hypothetical protein OEW17_11860 [Gemmatimonadota bacterium]|nr:hypothetical protein [Gemmatimonadota bacterium]MDH4349493.1 hypothetical protein [Gemmatimonadota bacterium]MDH5283173.1 hypothetical protein [Gemmatimonadota bacterium]